MRNSFRLKIIPDHLRLFLNPFFFLILFYGTTGSAQPKVVDTSIYRSPVDEQLTVHRVTVAPAIDNLSGIYARPLEAHLVSLLEKQGRFELVTLSTAGPLLSPLEFEENPNQVQNILKGSGADSLFSLQIVKGPKGLSFHLSLLLGSDGKLLANATRKEVQKIDIQELKEELETLLTEVLAKIPYDGMILSREGERVTVNLGRNSGLTEKQSISVVQIIQIVRHPKFHFLIKTEKEILGRILLLKVDETLSFGKIVVEREKGAIQKGAKIAGLESVTYTNTGSLSDTPAETDSLKAREDSLISFGKAPEAWVPKRKPMYGQVGAFLGLGQATYNMALSGQSLQGKDLMYPFVEVQGELWLTGEWNVHFGFQQGILEFENPRSSSQPSSLSGSYSGYEFLFGYSFKENGSLWGPNLELLGGYSLSKLYVDSSDPVGLTTLEYSGLKFGLRGGYPMDTSQSILLGAELYYHFRPGMNETPVSSGSKDTNSITKFGFFGTKRITQNVRVEGKLDMSLFSTEFTGSGTRSSPSSATSASQNFLNLSAGIFYLF